MLEWNLGDSLPMVSVIMPVRNEEQFIKRSLDSVLAQTYPPERTEILVIDGMSTDGTRNIIEQSANRTTVCESSSRVRMIDSTSQHVPKALNIGLAQSRGDIIFRLDGHSEFAPNYVAACVRTLQQRPDVICVGGPSVAVGSGCVGQAYALALRSRFGVGGSTFRTLRKEAYVDTLAFGGYRREVFAELGGFDPELERNQDIEFSARLRKAGHKMLLIQSTHTIYHPPNRLSTILRQCHKNGNWNTRLFTTMIGVLSWRHFIPGAFVASILGFALAAPIFAAARLALLLLIGGYVVSCLLASLWTALRCRQRCAAVLPVIFPSMHLSYGLGSLVGFCQFAAAVGLRWVR